jgi:hypothetical protein
MSEMVEQVARAIYARRKEHADAAGTELEAWPEDGSIPQAIEDEAIAAIEAMRSPTDAMVEAADSDWGPGLRDNWRDMIDAALER